MGVWTLNICNSRKHGSFFLANRSNFAIGPLELWQMFEFNVCFRGLLNFNIGLVFVSFSRGS